MAKNPTIGPNMKNLLGPKNVPTVGPLPKLGDKDRVYKGFNIKRQKDPKGNSFSFTMHKKIKGFEEEMSNIDEAEGIKTVSTKGYHGSKPKNPKYRGLTKGFINWKGGKPEGEADEKVLAWHKGEAAKEGKVVQLRYRGPRGKGPSGLTRRMGVGPQQSHTTKGAGTGAAVYYKDKWQLGGRQRAKHWGWDKRNEELDEMKRETLKTYAGQAFKSRQKAADSGDEKTYRKRAKGYMQAVNRVAGFYEPKPKKRITKYHHEETEMEDGKYEVIYENEVEQNEEQPEVNGPVVSDLVMNAIEQKPLEFSQTFAELMQQRIEDAVHDKKLEIASVFVNPSQYEAGEDEGPEDEQEVESDDKVETEEPEVQEEE